MKHPAVICVLMCLLMVRALAEPIPVQYARQFSLEKLDDGCTLLVIAGHDRFLIVPEDRAAPSVDGATVILHQPLDSIYLSATSAMDMIYRLDALDAVTLSGTKADGWYIPAAAEAMEEGRMRYAGKYSAPDFELMLEHECQLAVESTMIYHSPDVKEQLEELGIPVLVERSSYESHPLGRMEWIKVYGALLGKEAEATALFQEQAERVEQVAALPDTGKTAAFFSINSMGAVNVRKNGDYIVRAMKMAGGTYALADQLNDDENALSTMNIQMEDFFAGARQADVLIYNSTIAGELNTLAQLLKKNPLLSEFRAIQTGQVYCTERQFFQESMGIAELILDMHQVFTGGDSDRPLYYLKKLE